MKDIEREIFALGGRQYRTCYRVFYLAVKTTIASLPAYPRLADICAEIRDGAHKNLQSTVSRDLARVVDDLWEYGDMERIVEYDRSWAVQKPKPKELLFTIAKSIKYD